MSSETQALSPIQSIVREETRDGRLIVRFLVAAMQDEIRDAKPHHRLDAARQLIKLGFDEAKEFASIPATSLKRAEHPKPEADTIDTANLNPDLALFIRAETDGGRRAVRFLVDVMLGFMPGFGPHHRIDAAKELLRRGFDEAPADLPLFPQPSQIPSNEPVLSPSNEPVLSPSNEPVLSLSKEPVGPQQTSSDDSPTEADVLLDYEPPYVNTYGHSRDDGLNTRAVFKASDALMDAVGRLPPPEKPGAFNPDETSSIIVHNGTEHYFKEHARTAVELSIAAGEVMDAIRRIRDSCRTPSAFLAQNTKKDSDPGEEPADDDGSPSQPRPGLVEGVPPGNADAPP